MQRISSLVVAVGVVNLCRCQCVPSEGTLGGYCHSDGTCQDGLVCKAGMCAEPASSSDAAIAPDVGVQDRTTSDRWHDAANGDAADRDRVASDAAPATDHAAGDANYSPDLAANDMATAADRATLDLLAIADGPTGDVAAAQDHASSDQPASRDRVGLGCLIEPEPGQPDFGTLTTAQTRTLMVRLRNVGDAPCMVRTVAVTVGASDFAVGDLSIPFVGVAVDVDAWLDVPVEFAPQATGTKSGTLHVVYRAAGFGSPDQSLDIALAGICAAPAICVSPATIDFGSVTPSQTQCRNIDISNCGPAELFVRGISLQTGSSRAFSVTPGSSVPGRLQPGRTTTVTACYRPTSVGGDLGALEIWSDDPANSTTKVMLRGNVSGLCPALLRCQPTPLDMGAIEQNVDLARTIVCSNHGDESIVVNSVSVTPAPLFAVSARLPATLAPGEQLIVQVKFRSSSTGVVTGNVDVLSTACNPDISVSLVAEAIATSPPTCGGPRNHSPLMLWQWQGSSVEPQANQVWTTPLVANIDDDNGDGVIDAKDMPDVVFSSFDAAEFRRNIDLQDGNLDHVNDPIKAYLRVVSGDNGQEIYSASGDDSALDSEAVSAIADIDGDNKPEIVGVKWLVLPGEELYSGGGKVGGKFKAGYLIAFENDGTVKWISEQWRGRKEFIENAGAVAVADIDHDGFPEIIFGASVFDHTGRALWHGAAGAGNSGHGPQSYAANLDNTGDLEIIAGNTVYGSDGSILWTRDDLADGPAFAVDLDGDSAPEIVLHNADGGDCFGRLYVLDALTGATIGNGYTVPNPNPPDDDPNLPGVQCYTTPIPTTPAAADFDGDGLPEIAVANQSALALFDGNGALKWSAAIDDRTGMAGATGFDFEGDGRYEVVYADESKAWAHSTIDGVPYFARTFEANRASRTIAEVAVVADINNDLRAELLVAFNEPLLGLARGIGAFTDAGGAWVGTRRIYNQQAYHLTNIDEFATVPRDEQPNWLAGVSQNSFHTQAPRCR